MRYIPFLTLAIFLCSCGNNPKKGDNIYTRTGDTSFYFIKRILNTNPDQVAKVLGKPDNGIKETKDCTDSRHGCQAAEYQHGKYELEYNDEGQLKTVTINNVGKLFNDGFISTFNFNQSLKPFQNDGCIRWTHVKGLKDMAIFPDSVGGIDYAIITVAEDNSTQFSLE